MKAEAAWLVLAASARLTFRRIELLIVVNVLWWLLSLSVLTWPPATAGLYHVARRLANPEESEQTTWHHFFEGFRSYWGRSWKLVAVDMALIAILVVTFLFYLNRSQWVLRLLLVPVFYFMILWGGMQLYLFPLFIEQEDKRIRLVFKNAFILATGNPSFTFLLGFLLTAVTIIATVLAGPVLFVLISFLAVTQTLALQKLLASQCH
ncbi:MAG: hypothetical protein MAG451_03134 [Anaerolineales bacterium]|nr:hypothetical protein [Anaerolineales bacterium]